MRSRSGRRPNFGRGRFALVAAVLVLLLAAGGGTALYLGATNASRADRFRRQARDDWSGLVAEARAVTSALDSVTSPETLDVVAEAAEGMADSLEEVAAGLEGERTPAGYGAVSERQKAAVAELRSYVQKIIELSRVKEEKALAEQRGLLENRSRRARQSVDSFLSEADFVTVTMPGDFYHAGSGMARAYQPPDYAGDAERKAIYDTMNEFMRADVRDGDFEKVWSMLSSRMIYGLEYNRITRERLAANWKSMWGDKNPVDYYVSWRDINIPYPTTATSVVIAYMDDGGPRSQTVRLVKEQGVWKIDSYPFVGLLG